MPFLLVMSLVAPSAPRAAAEELQGHVLAGRSVQVMAASPAGVPNTVARNAAPSSANTFVGVPPGAPEGKTPDAAPKDAPAAANATLRVGQDFGIDAVRVTIVNARNPAETFTTLTGPDGRFTLGGLRAGAYRVTLSHAVLGERSLQALVGKGAGELEFVWEVAPGRPPGELPLPAGR